MSQREIMVKLSELETALTEAGVDPEVAQEFFDGLELEIQDLLDKVDQDFKEVESEDDSESDEDGDDQ